MYLVSILKKITLILMTFAMLILAACTVAPQTADITLDNVHESQPLAPGVVVLHTSDASLNFEGQLAPPGLEQLAEVGNPAVFAEYVSGLEGVVSVITTEAPIMPGTFTTITAELPEEGLLLSVLMMPVGTNDGFALIDAVPIEGVDTVSASNYDAGTEENSALMSGFDGGQPEPSRGEENLENGNPTEEPVSAHPELTETVLAVSVS